MLSFLVFENNWELLRKFREINLEFREIYWEFRENQQFYFREIPNNFVQILCFAKFEKCCFAATLAAVLKKPELFFASARFLRALLLHTITHKNWTRFNPGRDSWMWKEVFYFDWPFLYTLFDPPTNKELLYPVCESWMNDLIFDEAVRSKLSKKFF